MRAKKNEIKDARCRYLAAMIIVILWLGAGLIGTISAASETTTIQATIVMSGPNPAILPAGDDEGHLVGLGQRAGEAIFDDSRKARYSNVFFLDWYRGKSADMWGYTKMVFDDNSWFFFKWNSTTVGSDENGPIGKGAGTILEGTGIYEGIQGKVEFTNRRLKDPSGATEAVADFTYTLP